MRMMISEWQMKTGMCTERFRKMGSRKRMRMTRKI